MIELSITIDITNNIVALIVVCCGLLLSQMREEKPDRTVIATTALKRCGWMFYTERAQRSHKALAVLSPQVTRSSSI